VVRHFLKDLFITEQLGPILFVVAEASFRLHLHANHLSEVKGLVHVNFDLVFLSESLVFLYLPFALYLSQSESVLLGSSNLFNSFVAGLRIFQVGEDLQIPPIVIKVIGVLTQMFLNLSHILSHFFVS
jgi:hypothetical protein